MEKEKLVIKNFGPIKEVELYLGRVTVLIGEQATGKSTIAKVLAVCRYFSYIADIKSRLKENPFKIGLDDWGLSHCLQNGSSIYYRCNHYEFDFSYSFVDDRFDFDETRNFSSSKLPTHFFNINSLSKDFEQVVKTYKEYHRHDIFYDANDINVHGFNDVGVVPYSFYKDIVSKVMHNPFYLPAERGLQSIFSLGQAGIRSMHSFLFNYFSKVDSILRLFKTEIIITPLNVRYINQNGIGFVKKNYENKFQLLSDAASGYQTIIPIVLVTKYYNELLKRSKTFIVEEPELNLFPSAQKKVIEFLVEQVNKFDNEILLTTHSPYTLTSLNNLMYAYTVGQMHPDEVNKIIDKKYWINPDDVSAYMLKADGTAESIIDEEEKMIVAEKIDGVSKFINKEFNDLMNIELEIDAENN